MHPPPKESARESVPYSEDQRNGPQGNPPYLDTSRIGGQPQQMRVALLATAFLGACGGAPSLPEGTGSGPPEPRETIPQEQSAAAGAKTAWEPPRLHRPHP